MLIKESAIKQNAGMPMLEDMQFIDMELNTAAMIPVVESTSRETKLISLEDVMGFAESQNIADLGQALTQICETNQIDPNTVTFTVNEDSILDEEAGIAGIVESMMANGINVLAKPVMEPEMDSLAEEVIAHCVQNDDTALFEEFCGLTEAKKTSLKSDIDNNIGPGNVKKPLAGGAHKAKEDAYNRMNWDATPEKNPNAMGLKDKIQQMLVTAKNKGRVFIRRQLVRLHKMVKNFNAKAQQEHAPIWQKLASIATRAIETLTRYLKSAVG